MARAVAFSIVFILALIVAAVAGRPPVPVAADAPATGFSAMRAMADVEIIADRPHPIGSRDILRVRQYLRDRLEGLGLDVIPDREQQPFFVPGRVARTLVTGRVHNVIGILKGADPDLPALLLMSHYDSVANSPGAADDTAGVAATLEIIANLKARGALKRDVIALFTEGEESGLLGARAFFTEDPLARHVGLALNLESRGGGGRTFMFETSDHAGGLVSAYGDAVASPAANSLSAFIYRIMPNGTDLTNALAVGIPGMNFAFIGDELAYHTASATPDRLDRGSLQHMGDQVLALTAALGNADDLKASAPNIVYADLLGLAFVSYPHAAGWVLIAVLAGLLGYTITQARRRGLLHIGESLFGIVYFVGVAVLIGAILFAAKAALGRLPDFQLKYALIGYHGLFLGGCTLLAAALVIGVAVLLRRRLSLWGAWLGGLVLLFVISFALQVFAPGTTILFAWPLLPLALAAALVMALADGDLDSDRGLAIAAVLSFIAAALLTANGAAVFLGLGGFLPSVIAIPALLLAIALYPGIEALARLPHAALAAVVAVVISFIALGYAAFGPASADHPRLTQAYYLAGPDANDYAYVSSLTRLDDWSRAVLTADGGAPEFGVLTPGYRQPAWRAKARPAAVPRPVLDSNVQAAQGRQRVTLTITPGGAAPRELRFILKADTDIADFAIDGEPADLAIEPGEWSQFLYAAPTKRGATISFTANARGAATLRVFEVSDGWPDGISVPPKPEGLTPWMMSDTTYAASSLDVQWPAP